MKASAARQRCLVEVHSRTAEDLPDNSLPLGSPLGPRNVNIDVITLDVDKVVT